MRKRRAAAAAALALACGLAVIRWSESGAAAQAPSGQAAVQMKNVAEAAGITFVHQHSPTPEKYYVESAPGGLAVFDYNGDGRPDIFFTNGAPTPSLEKSSPTVRQPPLSQRRRHAVHRRDRGRGRARASATPWARPPPTTTTTATSISSSPACGSNQLLRNRGDGRFEDVTATARASPAATGPSPAAGSTTTTTAGSICSSSTTCSGRPRRTATAATRRGASASTAIPRFFQGLPESPLPQSGRRHLRGRLGARRPRWRTSARA